MIVEQYTLLYFYGDLFNNNSGLTNFFETEIWAKLLEFKEKGITLFTIVGNHDQQFQNETEFKGTYLYKAFLAGIIKHLDELTIDGVHIVGIDYNKDFIKEDEYTKYSICVAHSFYENEMFGGTGNSNLTDKKCLDLGYQAYVLGHDHTPYPTINEKGYTVVRPGSLTRGTSKTCNLYRKVNVALFDTISLEWSEVEIPTKPGAEVFNEKVILQKGTDIDLTELLNNLSVKKYENLYDIIDDLEDSGRERLKDLYPEVINIITQYCEAEGMYRKVGALID